MEEWKSIEDTGWMVSNLGNIKKPDGRCIKFRSHYYRKCKVGCVHRLVAYYFCNPPFSGKGEGYEVHHKNRMPFDNTAENLEWLTIEEHQKLHRAEKHKSAYRRRKYKKPKSQKDVIEYEDIPINKELINIFLDSLKK